MGSSAHTLTTIPQQNYYPNLGIPICTLCNSIYIYSILILFIDVTMRDSFVAHRHPQPSQRIHPIQTTNPQNKPHTMTTRSQARKTRSGGPATSPVTPVTAKRGTTKGATANGPTKKPTLKKATKDAEGEGEVEGKGAGKQGAASASKKKGKR